ncbi:MAG: 4'-phosphopantetheinyl transferase superfamily protein [Lachnospiraceae bacterium]|nr:4'-phosphopantetheinyl transferase superfamily protein [Lachnospiraceae bacterium]
MNTLYVTDISLIEPDDAYSEALSRLNRERAEKAEKCKKKGDRLRSVAASLLLDIGLSAYGLSLKEADILLLPCGKPVINGRPDIHFSLSHSGDHAVAAFSDEEVGVDIEKHRPVKDSLVKHVLDDEELKEYSALGGGQDLFFDLWTKKESFLKKLGTGLTVRPRDISLKFRNELESVDFHVYHELKGYSLTLCTGLERPSLTFISRL